jgi:DNA-binding winged helix-turn-helix (wHTH) protein/tetratricopeptide (TPR) repeat protein
MEEVGRFAEKNLTGLIARPGAGRVWDFAEFRLEEAERRLTRRGEAVALTPKTFDLLVYFLERAGNLVRKDELLARLWPNTFVEEGTLARHVSSLRRALGPQSEGARIQTVHKSGYRLNGEVRIAGTVCGDEGADPRPLRTLAVLPFRTLPPWSGDGTLELGLADALIARLSALRELCVRSLSAVRPFAGSAVEPVEAGRRLQVDAVLEGTLQREGPRVRLNARLVEVDDGRALWSRTFEQRFESLFALEDEVASQVTSALLPALSPPARALSATGTRDAAAYEMYLRGRYFWARRSEDALKKALSHFDDALAHDASLTQAHAARADALTLLAGYGVPPRVLEEARASARRALDLDPDCADAHTVLGLIAQKRDRSWQEAEAHYRSALRLHPNHVTALHRYGELLALRGRFDEGLALLERVRQMDPTSLILCSDRAKAFFFARRYAEAVRASRSVLELDPTFARAHLYLGLSLLLDGDHDSALEAIAVFAATDRTAYACGIEAYACGVTGRTEAAGELLAQLHARERVGYVTPHALALAYVGLGAHEQALAWIERIVEGGHNVLGLDISPLMDPVRAQARFLHLMQRARLIA